MTALVSSMSLILSFSLSKTSLPQTTLSGADVSGGEGIKGAGSGGGKVTTDSFCDFVYWGQAN